MVIFCPMAQLGCFNASSRRTSFSLSLFQPRNGPPEAVSRILRIRPLLSPFRHWKIALCSLSTGRICTPFSFARGMMRWPAVTNVSLFASAMSFPALMASMVGKIPIIPTIAVTKISTSGRVDTSIKPSIPLTMRTGRSRTAKRSFLAALSSQTAAMRGRNCLICASSRRILLPAARAAT